MSVKKTLFYFLLSGGLTVLVWLLLTSLHPPIDSYIIEGRVEALFGDPTYAKIKYTTDDRIADIRGLPEIDVLADGTFSSVINVARNSVVYFYAWKDGYSPARVQEVMQSTTQPNQVPILRITSLYQKGYEHILEPDRQPLLPLYGGQECPNLTRPVISPRVDKIQYFEDMRLLTACRIDQRAIVLKAKLGLNGFTGDDVFIVLDRMPDGQVVINQRRLPADPAIGTRATQLISASPGKQD